MCEKPRWGADSLVCWGSYNIHRRIKGEIWSSHGHRPSPYLLNKIHQDSVSLGEYITFAKISSEKEITLQTVTPPFKAIWKEVPAPTTDGILDDGLFRSLSHPFMYQSSHASPAHLPLIHTFPTIELSDLIYYIHLSRKDKKYIKIKIYAMSDLLRKFFYIHLP